jgi:hypothetical protein
MLRVEDLVYLKNLKTLKIGIHEAAGSLITFVTDPHHVKNMELEVLEIEGNPSY